MSKDQTGDSSIVDVFEASRQRATQLMRAVNPTPSIEGKQMALKKLNKHGVALQAQIIAKQKEEEADAKQKLAHGKKLQKFWA